MHNFFIHYATNLTNNLIAKLNIDSFCSNGICYYSRCENFHCDVQFCKYNLVTGEVKCTISYTKNKDSFKINLQANSIKNMLYIKDESSINNMEDSEMKNEINYNL